MKANLTPADRTIRGIFAIVALGLALSIGRHSWWSIPLGVVGALLLLSATTGFCHVRKALGDLGDIRKN